MAEGKNSFIKSKMNKDLDERLIPNNEYRDATNVAISRSEASDVGALEAILGNQLVGNATSAAAEIIGYVVDDTNRVVYYLKTDHNSNSVAPSTANCSIEMITLGNQTGTTTVLVSGSWLNFSKSHRVTGINLVEDLLFWTDNRNQPRKINVNRAQSDSSYYYNEDQISVAKFAPITPPEYINLRDTETNWYGTPDLKPSTMSDASDPSTVRANILTVSNENLAVTKYRNGDQIDGPLFTVAEWDAKDSAQVGAYCIYEDYTGNGVTYGFLYNKWAVIDPRGLAPIGFKVPSLAEWTTIVQADSMTQQKSINYWANNPGNNLSGLNVRPGGYRPNTNSNTFQHITGQAFYWTSDAAAGSNTPFVKYSDTTASTADVSGQTDTKAGMSIRVIEDASQQYQGWNGDEDFLTEKFVRFSYRFKFDDNEYSVVAPFSQDVFIPFQEGKFVNDDENQAFITTVVEFMTNSINNAVLNIPLPCIDIIDKYKIKAIDIIFKESDKLSYQVLESITVDQDFINSLNNTNIYQYNYQSTIPITTLPSFETSRVFDKVPVQALAQEITGNRVMYSNYLEGWTAPRSLDYYVDVTTKSQQQFVEYPQHSLKQNRNYQVGVVLADKFGRQTDIILSSQDAKLDSEGKPQAGSNYFSDYKPLSFTNDIDAWTGDTLQVNYLQPIPEDESGAYPGAYAQGNYFTVKMESTTDARYPYFWSNSSQYFTATANQTVFTTQAIDYADSQASANTLSVYVNSGDGYVLRDPSDSNLGYTVSDVTGKVRITFTNGITLNHNVKVQLLYTSQNLYSYTTSSASAARPLFPEFPAQWENYFGVGKYLSGQYIDYTEIVSATPTSDTDGVYKVDFMTKEQVNKSYLYNGAPTTRPEKTWTNGTEEVFATYDINVKGFYSYKFGVKQIEQDYYNVYLPGIINGYPVVGETLELDEIGFVTLISDNINKIPRDLQSVGPRDVQFTSDATVYPRVTNIVHVNSAPAGFFAVNKQIDPATSPDKVELIGTVSDLFPAPVDPNINPPDIKEQAIYDDESQPMLAKFTTNLRVGIPESDYATPASGTGNYPYPPNMGLAVLETTPLVSPLELFYETSTTGLISDLNLDVQNENTDITGNTWNNAVKDLTENDPIGTVVTSYFYPTASGQQVTTATLQILSIFSRSYPNNVIDTSIDYGPNGTNRLGLVADGSGGYAIQTLDTFYAGNGAVSGETLFDTDTRGNFQINIRWTQADGVTVDQTIDLQLQNSSPIVQNVPSTFDIAPSTASSTAIINANPNYTSSSPTGPAASPIGSNGCAANTYALQQAHTSDNSKTFNGTPSNSGYTILNCTKTWVGAGTNPTIYYGDLDSTGNNPISDIASIPFQGSQIFPSASGNQPSYWCFAMTATSAGTQAGYNYCYELRLTDTYGDTVDFTICYNCAATNFTGQVITKAYNQKASNTSTYGQVPRLGFPNSNSNSQSWGTITGGPGFTFAKWLGQIQNWTTSDVDIWAILSPGSGSNQGSATARCQPFAPGNTGQLGQKPDGQAWASTYGPVGFQADVNQTITTSPGTYSVVICRLKAFTPNAVQQSAGVRPGQKSPSSGGTAGTYDFSNSAMVNFGAQFTQYFTGATFTLKWTTQLGQAGGPNVVINGATNVTTINPSTQDPFYVSGGTSVGTQYYQTAVPIAAGP